MKSVFKMIYVFAGVFGICVSEILAFSVIDVTPAENSIANAMDTIITAVFDGDLDPASINTTSVRIHGSYHGSLTGSFSFTSDGLTFDPDSTLLAGEIVYVQITSAVESAGGNPSDPYMWQFITVTDTGVGAFEDTGQSINTGLSNKAAVGDVDGDGDVNGGGTLTAEDAQITFNIVLGIITPTYEQGCSADCDGSSTITAGDAQTIFFTVLGLDSCTDPN